MTPSPKISRLLEIMEALRTPVTGCPWDAEQTHRSLRRYLVEESAEAIDALDSFLWVTPEYNHGVPAAMRNAFDVLYPEWSHKAVGFVAYGADGGVRSVEQWRVITANARLMAVRAQVSLSTFSDFTDGDFTPQERRAKEVQNVVNQVIEVGEALAPLRA